MIQRIVASALRMPVVVAALAVLLVVVAALLAFGAIFVSNRLLDERGRA